MGRYYVITGLNEGVEIEPFIVGDDELDNALNCGCGDKCRYYDVFPNKPEAKAFLKDLVAKQNYFKSFGVNL